MGEERGKTETGEARKHLKEKRREGERKRRE